MTDTAVKPATQSIKVDEVFPHAPGTIWKALTDGALMGRWMMPPTGFEPVVGNRFTFHTTPAGLWDGTIACEVTEVIPNRRFVYVWKGGDEANVGYGAKLETIVTWTLEPAEGGTHVRLVHSGFVVEKNDTAYRSMSEGWSKVVSRLGAVIET